MRVAASSADSKMRGSASTANNKMRVTDRSVDSKMRIADSTADSKIQKYKNGEKISSKQEDSNMKENSEELSTDWTPFNPKYLYNN